MIIDNLYIRLIFHSMTLIYYDIVMIKVNFCKNPFFTNKKNRKCTRILILTLLIRKILILIIRDLQKKKSLINVLPLHYIKVPFIEIRLNRVRENSNSYKYY